MEHLILTETEFFRLIDSNGGHKEVSAAYSEFIATVVALCTGAADPRHPLPALSYAETELQYHKALQDMEAGHGVYARKALAFIRKMLKHLAASPIQVPPLNPQSKSDNHYRMTQPATALRWTGKASDLVEILYGMVEMRCINDGNTPVGELASFFYALFGVDAKDCYRIYSDMKLRKNTSRTYFLDCMQEKLNRRMDMDDEKERTRR